MIKIPDSDIGKDSEPHNGDVLPNKDVISSAPGIAKALLGDLRFRLGFAAETLAPDIKADEIPDALARAVLSDEETVFTTLEDLRLKMIKVLSRSMHRRGGLMKAS